jgi:GT2 family glycosyltransferase
VSRSRERAVPAAENRPRAWGKSLLLGDEKLYIRGVTYGTFSRADGGSGGFPDPDAVARDFARMAENGVNSVRTYTVPPAWLLDLALEYGLYVMVGVPWEEHITFLQDRSRARSIKQKVRTAVRDCAGHPAVLCYAVGNEIPSSIVRWHGKRRIERFIEQLYRVAKKEDPDALVTYINYPSTEYLELPFVDLVCFNVFLESGPQFEAYIDRLQNIADGRPLVVTETGLDSRSHSPDSQARALDWQVRSAFSAGCAGVFVFSWTDEWHRGGAEIQDWDFGLVDRTREPKPALLAVRNAFAELPFPNSVSWPRISVIVCTYNGEQTLRSCFEGLKRLDYPAYEVIVVNDGSTDATAEITRSYGLRLISTENQGLANARNEGLRAATGEIVAYIDSDAYPDPHWLSHLAVSFMKSSHAGVGGPNIPPPDGGHVAACVANAPGGPTHVLLSDREAEHIPGCNMAFRKASLDVIGGFDPQFRVAGDDVDICWRLQDQGWTVGFSPGALVWHHRRDHVRAYLKQQNEYGKAEALLERKWPERYNRVGHLSWAGRVYGNGAAKKLAWRRWKIYYGQWGTGLFQSVYQRVPGPLASLPLVPEWYLVLAALAALSVLGVLWAPLLLALPLLVLATSALVFEAVIGAARASFAHASGSRLATVRCRATTALLYMLQPLARLAGRLSYGLAPWRRRSVSALAVPMPRTSSIWCERWKSPEDRLQRVESELRQEGLVVRHGSEYDRWDLRVRGGILGATRIRMAVEEHGSGRQLVLYRSWPKLSRGGLVLPALFAALSLGAALDGASVAGAVLGAISLFLAGYAIRDCGTATGIVLRVINRQAQESESDARAAHDERSLPAPWPWPERKAKAGRSTAELRDAAMVGPAAESEEGDADGTAPSAPPMEQFPVPSTAPSRLHMMRREK